MSVYKDINNFSTDGGYKFGKGKEFERFYKGNEEVQM